MTEKTNDIWWHQQQEYMVPSIPCEGKKRQSVISRRPKDISMGLFNSILDTSHKCNIQKKCVMPGVWFGYCITFFPDLDTSINAVQLHLHLLCTLFSGYTAPLFSSITLFFQLSLHLKYHSATPVPWSGDAFTVFTYTIICFSCTLNTIG